MCDNCVGKASGVTHKCDKSDEISIINQQVIAVRFFRNKHIKARQQSAMSLVQSGKENARKRLSEKIKIMGAEQKAQLTIRSPGC